MADEIVDACEAEWDAHKDDCSAFVRAVMGRLGIGLDGNANQIVDTIRAGQPWQPLQNGPVSAEAAAAGKLVLAGLRGDEQQNHSNHGHVVVIVAGPLAHNRYPTAYWGRLGGGGAKYETINWAWRENDRDRVFYAAYTNP